MVAGTTCRVVAECSAARGSAEDKELRGACCLRATASSVQAHSLPPPARGRGAYGASAKTSGGWAAHRAKATSPVGAPSPNERAAEESPLLVPASAIRRAPPRSPDSRASGSPPFSRASRLDATALP
jgi:hypothetical protein